MTCFQHMNDKFTHPLWMEMWFDNTASHIFPSTHSSISQHLLFSSWCEKSKLRKRVSHTIIRSQIPPVLKRKTPIFQPPWKATPVFGRPKRGDKCWVSKVWNHVKCTHGSFYFPRKFHWVASSLLGHPVLTSVERKFHM